jgi:hypothetical protein
MHCFEWGLCNTDEGLTIRIDWLNARPHATATPCAGPDPHCHLTHQHIMMSNSINIRRSCHAPHSPSSTHHLSCLFSAVPPSPPTHPPHTHTHTVCTSRVNTYCCLLPPPLTHTHTPLHPAYQLGSLLLALLSYYHSQHTGCTSHVNTHRPR